MELAGLATLLELIFDFCKWLWLEFGSVLFFYLFIGIGAIAIISIIVGSYVTYQKRRERQDNWS